eukprot:CAMPEP_0182483108 /NCGR_PEP_ID=MMETSP1319-20130603/40653_1 /TAXON_ID=172717 /ORGANISM="Bolidomonas pacifica, Strain RCC208" /LENGTH=39 /DNA_ID= /DNA_START= /DNA_END= /DNA_ORIENTATION=
MAFTFDPSSPAWEGDGSKANEDDREKSRARRQGEDESDF